MAKGSQGTKAILAQFVKFGLVGLLNTIISYAIYVAALSLGAHYLVASVLGYVVSVFHAWVWQYFVVFKNEDEHGQVWWRSLAKTYASYAATGLVLNNILLLLLLDVIHIEFLFGWLFEQGEFLAFSSAQEFAKYIAPFCVLIVTIPINFILNKYWAFRSRHGKSE